MKYLAILKDSLREAVDTKVLYVMVGFSLLFTLFTASTGFAPLPPDEAIPAMVKSPEFRIVWPDRGKVASFNHAHWLTSNVDVGGIEQLTDGGSYTDRDYKFTLTVKESNPGSFHHDVDVWSRPPAPSSGDFHGRPRFNEIPKDNYAVRVTPELMEEFMGMQLAYVTDMTIRHVKVKELQAPDPKNEQGPQPGIYEIAVETQGSRGVRGWPTNISLLFGAIDPQSGILRAAPGMFIYIIEDVLLNTVGAWIALMVGVIITAFFIPNMLRKGTVDMLVSKPIHRPVLLIYKYIGGLTFMFLNSVVAIGGIWLMIGLRSGVWSNGFLCTILTLTFFFGILYAISTLFAVLTRSAIVSILMTILCWFGFYLIGQVHRLFTSVRIANDPPWRDDIASWVFSSVDAIHYVLPRTSDLNVLNSKLIAAVLTETERRQVLGVSLLADVNWYESVTASLAFIAVMLGLACWRFSRKDF